MPEKQARAHTFATGNLIACVNESPRSTLGREARSALLGTTDIGDILAVVEVQVAQAAADGSLKELHEDSVEWRPESVILRCPGLVLERAADGNVLIQHGSCSQAQTFVITGRAASAFNLPGEFRVEDDLCADPPAAGLVFRADAGWSCVIAATPARILEWKSTSQTGGEFRFRCAPTKDFRFVVTTDRSEETARKMANEAICRPQTVFAKAQETWRRFYEEEVPFYPLADDRFKSLYQMCWYALRSNRMSYGQPPLEKSFTCPSKFTYRHQWLWDSVFATMGLRWLHDKTAAAEEFENVLAHPYADGMLSHDLCHHGSLAKMWWPEGEGGRSTVAAPPVLGLGIEKVFETTQDPRLIEKAFPVMVRYVDWFFANLDSDRNQLVALRHTHESSWDNSPRWDQAMQKDRRLVPPVETVDTNCWLVCELQRLARWARLLGHKEQAKTFEERAARTAEAIRAVLWDERDQFFYDVAEVTHTSMRVKTPAAFLTLWGGIATGEQEKALVSHLTNPEEFWTKYPVPSVARNEPTFTSKDMFRGPTWANINWLVIQGLRLRDYHELAKELATRTLNMMISQGRPEAREWYDPDTGEPCGALNYGWSAGVGVDLVMDALKDERNGK